MAVTESTTTTANAIADYFADGWYEGVYRNDAVLGILRAIGMQEVTQTGGTGFKWHINSTGNTSVGVFSENDPAPQSVAQGWARPSVNWVYYWAWVTITGHDRDALRDGGIFDAVEASMVLAQREVVDLRSTTMLGSSNNGLQQAISASTTYAGITRGSASYFESATSSSTFSVANLRAFHRTIRSPDYGGNPTAHLVSPTVLELYAALGGTAVAATGGNSNLRYVAPADGSPSAFDYGLRLTGMNFYGRPIIEVPDLTSTVWISIDTTAGNLQHRIIRPFAVKFHHNEGDNEVYEVSTGSTLVKMMPKWDGVYTSIS